MSGLGHGPDYGTQEPIVQEKSVCHHQKNAITLAGKTAPQRKKLKRLDFSRSFSGFSHPLI
jgi:hypothetical protein